MKFTRTVLTISLALTSAPLYAQAREEWARVERLPLGGIVVVTDEVGAVVRGRLLRADAEAILLYAPLATSSQLKQLDELSRDQPQLLSRVDRFALDLPDSNLHIGLDGISRRGVRLALFDQVFHVSPRSRVMSVVLPQDQRHSYWATIAGVVVGAGAGMFTAAGIALSDEPCQPNCGPRARAAGAALVGGPILGGLIGRAIGKPRVDLLIYRRQPKRRDLSPSC